MKNVLITGISGFLGKNLEKVLTGRGYSVSGCNSANCDLTDIKNLKLFDGILFDEIYHLAAWTQAGDFCLRHAGEQWIINQQINTNVLTWWMKSQPQAKMIAMGTSCAYDPDLPLSEEYFLQGTPIESLFTYAQTKKMLYSGLLALNKQFGLRYLCFVPSTLYGGGYHTDGRQMHFIFDLIRKIIQGKYLNKPVVLWGNGFQKRELVLVTDFIDIMLNINDRYDNQLVNIGAGEEFSIREFASLICKFVDYDESLIHYDESKYTGATSKCLVVDKMLNMVPDVKMTSRQKGIQACVDYFMGNLEEVLKL